MIAEAVFWLLIVLAPGLIALAAAYDWWTKRTRRLADRRRDARLRARRVKGCKCERCSWAHGPIIDPTEGT